MASQSITQGPKTLSLRQIRDFRTCPRRYALCRGFGGVKSREVRSLPALIGIVSHQGVAEMFRTLAEGERPDIDAIVERSVQAVRENVEWSLSGRHIDHPDTPVMQEVLLGNGIEQSVLEEALFDTEQLIRNAARTQIADFAFADILKPEGERVVKLLEVEELQSFKIVVDDNELTIWLKCDLVARNLVRGNTVLVDWKTGKRPENDIEQAKLYALYLHLRYGVAEPQVRIIHLRGDQWSKPWKLTATAKDLLETKEWLAGEYRRLREAWASAESTTGDVRDLAGWLPIPRGSSACVYCQHAGPEHCDRRN